MYQKNKLHKNQNEVKYNNHRSLEKTGFGNTDAQTVSSSTASSTSTGASTRLERAERQDSEDYWDNILEI
eukprot:2088469-Amphidinium_carterae.1